MNWILNLKLRVKLILAFSSILILSAVLMLKAFQTTQTARKYKALNENIDGIGIDLLEMDIAIKYFVAEDFKSVEFLTKGESVSLQRFSRHYSDVIQRMNFIGKDTDYQNTIDTIASELQSVHKNAMLLAGLLKERGFKDYGLEGDLRKTIHLVENSDFPFDKVDMLTLRRHEKDFFLRKDLKYKDEFNKRLDGFVSKIIDQKNVGQADIIEQLRSYQSQFNAVVKLETSIGLQKDGLKGEIDQMLSAMKSQVMTIREEVKQADSDFQSRAWTLLIVLFLIQLGAGIGMAVFYADQITKPVKQLQGAISYFAAGVLPKKLSVRSTDEIGIAKLAFNQLIDRITAALDFSGALGEGNLKSRYDDRYRDDLFAQSLIKMQTRLGEAQEEQRVINWTNLGAAKLNEILKEEYETVNLLGDQIIKMIVTYVGANQGAIFMTVNSEAGRYAERIATYAYDKKRFVDQRIEEGEGLVGQCLLEKSTTIMKVVPSQYIKITSGLGEATPRFVMVMPLLMRGELMGIIEIAAFEHLQDYQMNFLEGIGQNIAAILYNKNTAERTKTLLDQARERAEELASQEEEIRQNAEEMQAITEQLEREKTQLQAEIGYYRAKVEKAEMVSLS